MESSDSREDGLPAPPPTAPPDAVRAAIKARVLAASLGQRAEPAKLAGRYRLIREIGRGGIGTVWAAELEPIGRKVAVKLLRAKRGQHADAAKRLVREAVSVSQIGHPHIVAVHDVGTDDAGAPYLVMDLLSGESLASLLLRESTLPWADAQAIAEQICDALAAAHELGVVHRDVKPANVFVRRNDDGRWHTTLLDFGLCKAIDADTVLTAEGMLLGTPGYMAPEQIRGDEVDARADVYAVACLVVEMLGGRPAFAGSRREEILAAQLAGTHAPLPASTSAMARDALLRALAVDPAVRPASIAALRRALVATSIDRTVPSVGATPRPRARVGLVVASVVIVAFAIGIASMQRWRSNDASAPIEAASVADEARGASDPPEEEIVRAKHDSAPIQPSPPPRRDASPTTTIEPSSAAAPVPAAPVRAEKIPRRARKPTTTSRRRDDATTLPADPPAKEPAPKRELVDGIRDPFSAE